MAPLERVKHSFLTRHGVFEISSDNGLISSYALRKARAEGGGEARPEVGGTTGTKRPEAE